MKIKTREDILKYKRNQEAIESLLYCYDILSLQNFPAHHNTRPSPPHLHDDIVIL